VIGDAATCGTDTLASRAHPPLGQWLIGAGIRFFGFNPVGWRIAAAVVGILTVALLYLVARRLATGVTPRLASAAATVAAGLLAVDFLHVVQSRIAMLDVFVCAFTVGAFACAVLDRDRMRDAAAEAAEGVEAARGWLDRFTFGHPWRVAAGAALGAATAVKWSGAYAAPGVLALFVAWDAARLGGDRGWWRGLLRAFRGALPATLLLVAVPAMVVYVASYTGRMPGQLIGLPWLDGTFWRNVFEHQRAMLDFHTSLGGNHPYESQPWSWLLDRRPVAYFFVDDGGSYREILALGNPVVWWTALAALVVLAVAWLRRGASWWAAAPVIGAGALSTYMPWLVLSGSRSQVFIWYVLPTVPFLCLAIGALVPRALASVSGRAAMGAFGVATVASLIYFGPLLGALPLAPAGWRQRIVFTDCQRDGAPTMTLPDDAVSSGPAPAGWCWI
jgi:dolichyl-phosphate-mannose--protein O-mannosyl transferase